MKESLICYVCKREIASGLTPVYIGAGKKHPNGLWRHKMCEPGGARWMDSDRAGESELTEFYANTEEES